MTGRVTGQEEPSSCGRGDKPKPSNPDPQVVAALAVCPGTISSSPDAQGGRACHGGRPSLPRRPAARARLPRVGDRSHLLTANGKHSLTSTALCGNAGLVNLAGGPFSSYAGDTRLGALSRKPI